MLTSETRVHWIVEGPRVAGSHLHGDWFPLVKLDSETEAEDYVVGLARKRREEGRDVGAWRIVEQKTRTRYLKTYMNVAAVLGPLSNEEEANDKC